MATKKQSDFEKNVDLRFKLAYIVGLTKIIHEDYVNLESCLLTLAMIQDEASKVLDETSN